MDISDVTRISGLPASTIRYYEQQGLIESIGRSGIRRQFKSNIIERLGIISLGVESGFSLRELKELFSEGGTTINRQRLLEKADELDAQISRLKSLRNGLRHAADCEHSDHLQCPKFKRLVQVARWKQARKR